MALQRERLMRRNVMWQPWEHTPAPCGGATLVELDEHRPASLQLLDYY
jgi:hypothetical protein